VRSKKTTQLTGIVLLTHLAVRINPGMWVGTFSRRKYQTWQQQWSNYRLKR